MSQFFPSGGQSIGASASASVLPMNIQLASFRIGWLNLRTVQGALKGLLQHRNLKASILWQSAFITVQPSYLYMTTGKTIALTIWTNFDYSKNKIYLNKQILGIPWWSSD